jgi:hypothetical protein
MSSSYARILRPTDFNSSAYVKVGAIEPGPDRRSPSAFEIGIHESPPLAGACPRPAGGVIDNEQRVVGCDIHQEMARGGRRPQVRGRASATRSWCEPSACPALRQTPAEVLQPRHEAESRGRDGQHSASRICVTGKFGMSTMSFSLAVGRRSDRPPEAREVIRGRLQILVFAATALAIPPGQPGCGSQRAAIIIGLERD